MDNPLKIVTYDVGTTWIKTCLFEIGKEVNLVDTETADYKLYILDNGGAEQDPMEWWAAMCSTTRKLLEKTAIEPTTIAGISFCSQMQGLVLVDRNGDPLRRAMTYMDQRADQEMHEAMNHGITVSGINLFKLIKSIRETGVVNASVKDPVWKYKWVEKHEPEIFDQIYKWLDVKEFLICRCTGNFIMTEDSAFAALLYNTREREKGWSSKICGMLGVKIDHLAEIIKSTDQAGRINAGAADELGLAEGTPVFGGGGDASLIGVGAGSVSTGNTHIYAGTSGWVSTVVEKPMLDTTTMIASIVGAQPGKFNFFAEMETAGKCLEWAKDSLALDHLGLYRDSTLCCDSVESVYTGIYDHLTRIAGEAPAGSGGVIFTPWLHGNRCPFEDSNSRGIFFNIKLETTKKDLLRAVLEGVCYHLRWMLEAQEKKIKTGDVIRFVGGGALSDITCQMLADITGRKVETIEKPQNVGAVGAAVITGLGLGVIGSFEEVKSAVRIYKTFTPDPKNREIYEKTFAVFKQLYKSNKKHFRGLNRS